MRQVRTAAAAQYCHCNHNGKQHKGACGEGLLFCQVQQQAQTNQKIPLSGAEEVIMCMQLLVLLVTRRQAAAGAGCMA